MRSELHDLRPLEPSDRAALEAGLSPDQRRLCEYSFANLRIWRDFDRPEIATMGGEICIRINPVSEPPFFLEPIGRNGVRAAAEACLDHTGRISRATRSFVDSLPKGKFRFAEIRNHYDYIYRVRDLAELRGRRFDGKRNHIRRFRRQFPHCRYSELRRSHAEAAIMLFEQWRETKRHCAEPGEALPELAFGCQRMALKRAFEEFCELGFMGGVIEADGRMIGFFIAAPLSENAACVPLAYCVPDVPGAFQALLWEGCRRTLAGFELVNLEQDLGIDGLRRYKESYYPVRMEQKFDVRR
jgi:hypothetical protein